MHRISLSTEELIVNGTRILPTFYNEHVLHLKSHCYHQLKQDTAQGQRYQEGIPIGKI